jgi:hypothetical protein
MNLLQISVTRLKIFSLLTLRPSIGNALFDEGEEEDTFEEE